MVLKFPVSRIMHLLSLQQSCSFHATLRFQVASSQMPPLRSNFDPKAIPVDHALKIDSNISTTTKHTNKEKDRIKEALLNTELSASSYDTAWVAMVPSPVSLKFPLFPKCIEWILENQHYDGSWGLYDHDRSLIKDALSCTLACVLALRKWNIGDEHIKRGLKFIGSNLSYSMDKKLLSPIGFDVIFPSMISYATDLDLDIPALQSDIDAILSVGDLEWKRLCGDNFNGCKAYIAYITEGLKEVHDWHNILKYQKRNGSLFNSPSATAALVLNTYDNKALNYLDSLMKISDYSVPAIYPLNIYTRLRIIDDLERFGMSQYFTSEIKSILDQIYRCWLQNDEEVMTEAATCALAFRILKMNGYAVSSDALAPFQEEYYFSNSIQGKIRDVGTVLELYKASHYRTLQNEQVLEKIELWTSRYLKQELCNNNEDRDEVNHAIKFPFYANLDRLEHKRNIEHYKPKEFQILKTSYKIRSLCNNDIWKMAVTEFNFSQSIYQNELQCLESWVKESKLDQLEFARQKLSYCYFSTAATLFSPEMCDARMSWAKNSVLTTVVDDFFDVGGSKEELENLITLIEKSRTNEIEEEGFCSEQVKIVFHAVYNTIKELGVKAIAYQNRDVTEHIRETWVDLMKSMMKEAEWTMNNTIPTLEEYMENGYVSFALGPIILPALYLVGPELSDDIVRCPEYHNLYKLVSMCGRCLNDIQGFQRETKEGKLNGLSLRIRQNNGSNAEEEAKKEVESIISSSRRELLRMVVSEENGVFPRECKDLFWKMSKVLHLFYMRNDGFSSPKEMVAAVNAVIHEPLQIAHLNLSSNERK